MIVPITMPKWGLTMTEGKVVAWLRPQGTAFARGDELLEIETSKITNVMEADDDGMLSRIVAPEGSTLPIGGLLAVAAPADTPAAEIDAFIVGFAVPEPVIADTETTAMPVPENLDIGGQRIRYLELGAGDGVPVLLLHGFGSDLNSWMFTQTALAEGRRVIALDLPGHGGSTKQVGAGDVASFAATVEASMSSLGLSRAHLIGHSMGGAVAATVAVRDPDRVASLTLIAAAGLGSEINAAFIDGLVHAARRRDMEQVLRLLVRDPAQISRVMVEDLLRYKRIDGVAAALETVARAWFPDGCQAVDLQAAITGLAMPVRLIWGREDQIVPVSQAEALAGRLTVHLVPDTGHLPHMERAGAVNSLIRRFIEP